MAQNFKNNSKFKFNFTQLTVRRSLSIASSIVGFYWSLVIRKHLLVNFTTFLAFEAAFSRILRPRRKKRRSKQNGSSLNLIFPARRIQKSVKTRRRNVNFGFSRNLSSKRWLIVFLPQASPALKKIGRGRQGVGRFSGRGGARALCRSELLEQAFSFVSNILWKGDLDTRKKAGKLSTWQWKVW